jgi:large subunit ribosomal protein L9
MLIPQKKGVEATPANLNSLKLKNANDAKMAKEALEAAKEFGKKIGASAVTVSIKTGENGKVFGSVSSREIADAAKEQLGFDLDKKKIQMNGVLKELGDHRIAIKLHPQVTAELTVHVTAE